MFIKPIKNYLQGTRSLAEEINQTWGTNASAGQIKAGFIGDRCQRKALGRENHVCRWEGLGQVSADLQSRREHRSSSSVAFKLSELLVCSSLLQQAAAESRLPAAGGLWMQEHGVQCSRGRSYHGTHRPGSEHILKVVHPTPHPTPSTAEEMEALAELMVCQNEAPYHLTSQGHSDQLKWAAGMAGGGGRTLS